MPADPPNTSAASSGRASRKLTSVEEIELKRSRGEISCAECRKSKLKCDKQIPCMSCARRGCSNICPNGIFTPGQTARSSNVPDTQHLHRKIFEMGQRIWQLENALAILQSNVSSEPHALLVEPLLSARPDPDGSSAQDKEDPKDTLKSFGTLTIGSSGEHKYFGASAGSETLLLVQLIAGTAPTMEELDPNISLGAAPDLLNSLASMTLMGGCVAGSETFESAITMLFAGLPPRLRAWSLCETYLEHFACHMQLVTRQDLIENILTPIYNAKQEREDPACEPVTQISPHKFALLYLVFARGVLADLTLPAYHADGETYHHYARAAMALRSFIDSPTVETVQAIVLMANYRSCAGERYTRDSVWALGSLGCKLAQSIGLHRDPGRWHMDERTVELRRRIFWEVYAADLFHSLALGRPPSIELSYVDCEFPTYDEEDYDAQYWNWKYKFTRDVFGLVLKLTLAAAPPSYKAILELDRKVREMVLPPALNVFLRTEDAQTYVSAGVYMKSYLLSSFRSFSMLFIHRSFFAQALLDHPENPLRSPYATSVLATYRAASFVINSMVKHLKQYPELFMRWWFVWTELFSAAVIVGSIATRAPSSSISYTALMELGLAVNLFERGAGVSERARTGLAILQKLKEKASLVLYQYHSSTNGGAHPPNSLILTSQEDGTDELALFGGQTSVLVSKTLSRKTSSWNRTSNLSAMAGWPVSSSLASPSLSPWPDQGSFQDIHPSLVQYASLFPPTTVSTDFTGHPAPNFEPHSLGQFTVDVNDSVPVSWSAQMPSHLQTGAPSSAILGSTTNDANSYDLFQDLYPETPATAINTWGSNDMTDLGQMMSVDSDMDEQWIAFVKESGIVNPTTFDV